MARVRRTVLIVLISTGLAACLSTAPLDGIVLDPGQVSELRARIGSDSTDAEALRDLGAYYLRQHQYDQSRPLLIRAHALGSGDPYVRFYYGLSLEQADSLDKAIRLYATYREIPRHSRDRRLRRAMAGRYESVLRSQMRQELDSLVHLEESRPGTLADSLVPPNTVAVFPFRFLGGDDRYSYLGRGLSTLLMMDLARVASLRVVERLRLKVVLDELMLSESEAVADDAAARVGRLLQARRLIGGTYAVSDDERVRLELALRGVVDDEVEELPAEDMLSRFFALEKELAFRLIEEMGIVLSEAERQQIEYIPTRNMQAFLAYSRGLAAEDAGRYGEAARLFREAGTTDPGFDEAVDRAEVNQGLEEAGAGIDEAIGSAGVPSADKDDLVRRRHESLGGNIGSLIVPGQDARDPASELAGGDDEPAIGRPPPPPASGGGN